MLIKKNEIERKRQNKNTQYTCIDRDIFYILNLNVNVETGNKSWKAHMRILRFYFPIALSHIFSIGMLFFFLSINHIRNTENEMFLFYSVCINVMVYKTLCGIIIIIIYLCMCWHALLFIFFINILLVTIIFFIFGKKK